MDWFLWLTGQVASRRRQPSNFDESQNDGSRGGAPRFWLVWKRAEEQNVSPFVTIEATSLLKLSRAVWRGYKEIRDAGGWVALVFAGAGIYRFCKYRTAINTEAITQLSRLRFRFEVAADTIHPHWRELLSIVGSSTTRVYHGHPHDWVVQDGREPVPLANTYLQWDSQFSYEHLDSAVLDENVWRESDPRSVSRRDDSTFTCESCKEKQSNNWRNNDCRCFPNLFGCDRGPCPVQVFRTANGRNNGLIACCVSENHRSTVLFLTNHLLGLWTRLCNWRIRRTRHKRSKGCRCYAKLDIRQCLSNLSAPPRELYQIHQPLMLSK